MNDPLSEPTASGHESLADVNAALRAQYRAEQRALEREAVYDHWSRRSIADVLAEAMRRGDPVRLQLPPSRRVTGKVTDVGRDFAVIENPRLRLVIRVTDRDGHPYQAPELLLAIPERAPSGGTNATNPHETFRAVLQRLDIDTQHDPRCRVEIGTTMSAQPLTGQIRALAADHLYLLDHDDVEHFIPLSAITYVACTKSNA